MSEQKRSYSALSIAYVGLFVALMAIGANLTSMITIGAIPLTLQTFFAIMAGALLGSRLGAVSMIVYMFVGLIGVPVFAQFHSGPAIIFSPTFGFIVSFIFTAYATGKIIEGSVNPGIPRFLFACFVGLILNYFIGTTLMYFALKYWIAGAHAITYLQAWIGMLPFLPKDIFFAIVAAIISPRIYKNVRKVQTSRAA